MDNCKIGLNEHSPYLKDEHHHEKEHHHHGETCHHDHHEHEHEHSHGHSHDHRGTDKKVLKWALSITAITMFLEFFYGFLSIFT